MGDKLYIVMPTYNEETNIKTVVEEWYPILEYADEGSKIVIADGGSKDKTLEILFEFPCSNPILHLLQKENGG